MGTREDYELPPLAPPKVTLPITKTSTAPAKAPQTISPQAHNPPRQHYPKRVHFKDDATTPQQQAVDARSTTITHSQLTTSGITPITGADQSATAAALAAAARNKARLDDVRQRYHHLLGKYTHHPLKIEDCIPDAIHLPIINPKQNPRLLQVINNIRSQPSPKLQPPPFKFEMNTVAADYNTDLLKEHNFDLHKILTSTHSICSPGAEFHDPNLLETLFHRHQLWPFAKSVLTSGAELYFDNQPDDTQRQRENEALIEFNNHHKAKLMPEIIQDSIVTDVRYGFAAPININIINDIPGSMVCPLGIAQQTTLAADGSRIEKNRLTHDQTFTLLDDSTSVNNSLNLDEYPDLIYGYCLQRIIYQILSLWFHFPTEAILLAKYDIKQAFRRVSYSGVSAYRCIAVFQEIAYLQLRMTFGGSNCPTTWCSLSELIADLANELLDCEDWNPSALQWPYQYLVPPATEPDTSAPLGRCLDTLLLPSPRPQGSVDIFIDDAIGTFLATPKYPTKGSAAVPLAVDVLARPFDPTDCPKREHMLAVSKLRAEGGPRETQIILGWQINTHNLTISLPQEKYLAWMSDIERFLAQRFAQQTELDSLVGRLNHVGYIIPLGRFF
jgi:hypothetical protein